jgi:2-keto-4-pentenoate hydratase/2-oxohepta-3-ene-1,7-dioic acid hydratase in catechol pathway
VGFARNPPEFLANGDFLDVWIEKIGHLKNTVTIA